MITLTPFKQSPGYCGPACLKMILSFYGIKKSEDELAELTKTTRDKGCSEKEIVKAAEKFGLKGFIKQNSTIKELKELNKKGTPVIVDWFSPEEEGHYSVVVDINDKKIKIADPRFGEIKEHDIKWFEERWYDLVEGEKIIKEIIVIQK